VEDKFLRRGIGTLLIQFALNIAFKISQQAGCRFLYLDAKRNQDNSKDVIHFYKKLGFEIYKERNERETPMYLDILPYIRELTDQ
jgi:ribosomal protein S18 acetylase RimI-like enzyme